MHFFQKSKLGTSLMIIGLFVFALFSPVYAIDSNPNTKTDIQTVSPPRLGTVTMAPNVTADVLGFMIIPSSTGQMASFTLAIHNQSDTDIDFIDYWARLETKLGTQYSVSLVSNNIDKILAKSNVNVQFYSSIGKNVKMSDLLVKVIRWDFSSDNYENVLGTIAVSKDYNPVTPANKQQLANASDGSLNLYVEHAVISQSEQYYQPDIKLKIENLGSKSVTLPDYQLSILTPEGYMYELQTADINNTSLGPLMSKEFQLSGSIPNQIKEGSWRLVLSLPVTDKKVEIPVALFELPESGAQQSGGDTGKYYSFADTNGVYYIKMDYINRLPIDDNDIITAQLTITNKGTTTLPVPPLSGEYLFDDSIKRDASVLMPGKMIGIEPGQSIELSEMCKIPYTYNPQKIKLTVQEKDLSGSSTSNLVSFDYSGDFNPIPTILQASSYSIQDIGYRSEVSIGKTQTFADLTSKVFATQVMVVNKEKRLSDIEQLAGYFESKDGTVYPATIEPFTEKIMPMADVMLYAWAPMPSNVDTKQLNLVLGRAISSTDSSSGSQTENQPTGYVNPVRFSLPEEQPAQENLNNIDIYPYRLSLDHVGTSLNYDAGDVFLKFNYNLEKDTLAKTNLDKTNIVIEISDDDNSISYTKTISLDQNSSGSDINFEIGAHSENVTWNNALKIFDISLMKKFNLNVYQELQPGEKKLLATQSFDWLVQND